MKTVTIYTDGGYCFANPNDVLSLAAGAATAKDDGKRRRAGGL